MTDEWTHSRVRERAGKHPIRPGVPVVWLTRVDREWGGFASEQVERSIALLQITISGVRKWIVAHCKDPVAERRLAVDDLDPLGALYLAAVETDIFHGMQDVCKAASQLRDEVIRKRYRPEPEPEPGGQEGSDGLNPYSDLPFAVRQEMVK